MRLRQALYATPESLEQVPGGDHVGDMRILADSSQKSCRGLVCERSLLSIEGRTKRRAVPKVEREG